MNQPDTSAHLLATALSLPCGISLSNRIAKSATSEALADNNNNATDKLISLYRRWSLAGAGLLITGNIMIDRRHMESPLNVAIDDNDGVEQLRAWAGAARVNGNQAWVQLSHAGRQANPDICPQPVSASDVQLKLPLQEFPKPRALTEAEILDIIKRFAKAAGVAKDAGFTGVQLHAAHGYLLSQFLSPRINLRTDQWGGSLENRSRLLVECIRAIRLVVGANFPVSIKLNTTDFMRGGFSNEDCLAVVALMNREGLDLLELSGGTYESMAMLSSHKTQAAEKESSGGSAIFSEKEAFFINNARAVKALAKMPVMVTGGFRNVQAMALALAGGDVDVIGLARPFCVEPEFAGEILTGRKTELSKFEETLELGPGIFGQQSPFKTFRVINTVGGAAWFTLQLGLIAEGKEPNWRLSIAEAIMRYLAQGKRAAKILQQSL